MSAHRSSKTLSACPRGHADPIELAHEVTGDIEAAVRCVFCRCAYVRVRGRWFEAPKRAEDTGGPFTRAGNAWNEGGSLVSGQRSATTLPPKGGCAPECACHCHSDDEEIPPGHVSGCLFADPDYVPPGWQEAAADVMRELEAEANAWARYNARGSS